MEIYLSLGITEKCYDEKWVYILLSLNYRIHHLYSLPFTYTKMAKRYPTMLTTQSSGPK